MTIQQKLRDVSAQYTLEDKVTLLTDICEELLWQIEDLKKATQ